MITEKFVYKPAYVEASLPITEENMAEIAEWCGGDIQSGPARFGKDEPSKFIKVDVVRPMTIRQTQAFVGDRVVKTQYQGFKVFSPRAFNGSFKPVVEAKDAVTPAPSNA